MEIYFEQYQRFLILTLRETNATLVEKEGYGYGYVVASLDELGGIVPYTAYNAKISYLEKNPEVIENFTKAIQKGLDFVNSKSSKEIAEVILPEFPDTSLSDMITVIDRYKNADTWPTTTEFTEESFNHLQDIMVNAKQLDKRVSYKDLIYQK